jgi:DNA-directed RNA polymerase specialized sigma24 family protein
LLGSEREAALVESIRRYGLMVKRTAWRITGDEHSAEDDCQAVFMVLVRRAASLTGVTLLGAWLFQVAVMSARNVVKSQARRQRREQESVMLTPGPRGVEQANRACGEAYQHSCARFVHQTCTRQCSQAGGFPV